jgi:5-methylcytosine-specific restriction endonuclease McrA
MTNKKLNAVHVWKQMQDVLIPRLRLPVIERAVYTYLLRHSRLEGKRQLCFSIGSLARGACLSTTSVRRAVRCLVTAGVLRLVERSRAGHTVEVRLPDEIPALHAQKRARARAARPAGEANLEDVDFLESRALRNALYTREAGCCFYCLRRLAPMTRCLDHVVPRVRKGRNSYRNLVSACTECNSQKAARRAGNFLRWLFREGRLTATELKGRLCALGKLTSGMLRPRLPGPRTSGTKSPRHHKRPLSPGAFRRQVQV